MKTKFNKAFWDWFGNSKVVDENGEPLVVYHGTNAEFDVFKNKKGARTTFGFNAYVESKAFYFTPNYDLAYNYFALSKVEEDYEVNNKRTKPVVYTCYLRAENILDLSINNEEVEEKFYEFFGEYYWQYFGDTAFPNWWSLIDYNSNNVVDKIISQGYDGVKVAEKYDYENDVALEISYAVFSPNQIKSVNNDGTWDNDDDSILSGAKKTVYGWRRENNAVLSKLAGTYYFVQNGDYENDYKRWNRNLENDGYKLYKLSFDNLLEIDDNDITNTGLTSEDVYRLYKNNTWDVEYKKLKNNFLFLEDGHIIDIVVAKKIKELGYDGIKTGSYEIIDLRNFDYEESINRLKQYNDDDSILSDLDFVAYHGGFKNFDKFSTDFNRTGEGANTYGWGLYFTDVYDIANLYSNPEMAMYNAFASLGRGRDRKAVDLANDIMAKIYNDKKNGLTKKYKDIWRDSYEKYLFGGITHSYPYGMITKLGVNYFKEFMEKYVPDTDRSTVYTVKIGGDKLIHELNFMDWENEITNKQYNQILEQAKIESFDVTFDNLIGEFVYKKLSKIVPRKEEEIIEYGGRRYYIYPPDKLASLFLLRAGINGHYYKTAEQNSDDYDNYKPTYNYVVYDPALIEIQKKVSKITYIDGLDDDSILSGANVNIMNKLETLFKSKSMAYNEKKIYALASLIYDDNTLLENSEKWKNELSNKVDLLGKTHKKLYSNMDISIPKSKDEKELEKEIASIHSKTQGLIRFRNLIKSKKIDSKKEVWEMTMEEFKNSNVKNIKFKKYDFNKWTDKYIQDENEIVYNITNDKQYYIRHEKNTMCSRSKESKVGVHRSIIENAILDGKNVPLNVRKEYPYFANLKSAKEINEEVEKRKKENKLSKEN